MAHVPRHIAARALGQQGSRQLYALFRVDEGGWPGLGGRWQRRQRMRSDTAKPAHHRLENFVAQIEIDTRERAAQGNRQQPQTGCAVQVVDPPKAARFPLNAPSGSPTGPVMGRSLGRRRLPFDACGQREIEARQAHRQPGHCHRTKQLMASAARQRQTAMKAVQPRHEVGPVALPNAPGAVAQNAAGGRIDPQAIEAGRALRHARLHLDFDRASGLRIQRQLRDADARLVGFDLLDQSVGGQRGLHGLHGLAIAGVEQLRIQPRIQLVLEGEQAPSHPADDQEHGGDQAAPTVQRAQNAFHGARRLLGAGFTRCARSSRAARHPLLADGWCCYCCAAVGCRAGSSGG